MFRWQHKMHPSEWSNIYRFNETRNLYSGVLVKNYFMYPVRSRLVYLNIRTMSWTIHRKCDIRLYDNNELSENAVFHLNDAFTNSVNAYIYDPDNNSCFYVPLHGTYRVLHNTPWEFNKCSYLLNAGFYRTGEIDQFSHTDRQWRKVHLTEWREIYEQRDATAKNQLVTLVYKTARRGFAVAAMNMTSWDWETLGRLDNEYQYGMEFVLRSILYIKYMHNEAIGEINGRKILVQGQPAMYVHLKSFFRLGKRFIFPTMRISGTFPDYKIDFICDVLNTNTTLKDLAMEVIVKNEIKLDGLPQSLRDEIHLFFGPSDFSVLKCDVADYVEVVKTFGTYHI